MTDELSCVIVKPDGVGKAVVGKIVTRLEAEGFRLTAARMVRPTPDLLGGFYAEHKGKPFYDGLLKFISSGKVTTTTTLRHVTPRAAHYGLTSIIPGEPVDTVVETAVLDVSIGPQWEMTVATTGARVPATVLAIDGDGRGLRVVDEEVFGPVLTVHVYDAWNDALRMADATRYGLQAGLFTDSMARVSEAFERLEVGGLVINDTPSVRVDAMPYGGARDSGLGREGVRYAIEKLTQPKMLVVRSR